MSLIPDYFISNCGYPKLNHEKFKPIQTQRLQRSFEKKQLTIDQTTNNLCCYMNSKKKLLNKRTTNNNYTNLSILDINKKNKNDDTNTTSRNNNLTNDKQYKCYFNQKLKDKTNKNIIELRNRPTEQQLDNRLSYNKLMRNFYGTIQHNNETDILIRPPSEI